VAIDLESLVVEQLLWIFLGTTLFEGFFLFCLSICFLFPLALFCLSSLCSYMSVLISVCVSVYLLKSKNE